MQTIEGFARNLVDVRIENEHRTVSPQLRDKVVRRVAEQLDDFIHRYIVESMDPATRARLQKFLATDPPHAEVQRFMEFNTPNKDQLVVEAMQEFRKTYLGY